MNIASSGKKIDTNDKTVADINSAPASMGLPRPPVAQLAGIQLIKTIPLKFLSVI